MRRAMVVVTLLLFASAASAQGRWGGRWRYGDGERDRRHAHVHLGGNFTLPQDSTSDGPLILIGGNSRIDGHVEDDVVAIGGNIHIGPTAIIDGDLVRLGGNVTTEPGAQIRGDVTGLQPDWPDLNFHWPQMGNVAWPQGNWWTRGVALGATIGRLCLVFFGGLLALLIAPGWMRRMAQRVSAAPGVSAVIGLATEMFLGPALIALAIALAISIVGIPLLAGIPLLLAVLACVWVAGFAATAARVGASIRGEHGSWLDPRVGDFVIGFFALTAVTLVGRILAFGPLWFTPIASMISGTGLFIEYCAWTLGLGAAIGAVVGARTQPPPPPVPPIPASSAS